ncbi:hypothetical protein [Actinomadura gamaensis]|uniref:Uncharacterized protein n=1 Tax=Actinomadura gamaensis TaxID=1763541 RepID=A0ABV9U9F2_9ACTN
MRTRPVGLPMFAGLGAAAVLAFGGLVAPAAFADDSTPTTGASDTPGSGSSGSSGPSGSSGTTPTDTPTPTPSDSTPTDPPTTPTDPPTTPPTTPPTDPGGGTPGGGGSTPPGGGTPGGGGSPGGNVPTGGPTTPGGGNGKPGLGLGIRLSTSAVHAGDTVSVSVSVSGTATGVSVSLGASGGASASPSSTWLGNVSGSTSALGSVTVPSGTKPGTIRITATVTSSNAGAHSTSTALTVVAASVTIPGNGHGGPTGPYGTLPPGVNAPPPGLDPLGDRNPFQAPAVALPPVAGPQVAGISLPMSPVTSLQAAHEPLLSGAEPGALAWAGAAVLAASGLLLTPRYVTRRRRAQARDERTNWILLGKGITARDLTEKGLVQLNLAEKRLTVARMRALPPQPAPARRRLLRPRPRFGN